MTKLIRFLRQLLISLSCLALVASCSLNPNHASSGKQLIVATDLAFPPFEVSGGDNHPRTKMVEGFEALAPAQNFQDY